MDNNRSKRNNRNRRRNDEIRDEFDQEVIDLARVTRVMAGGKRMRFRACVAVGDKKGRVGIGIAKGADVSMAISKASRDAKKHLVNVNLTKAGSIPHEIRLKKYSAKIMLKPAEGGTGVIAGSVLRQVLELVGARDIVGKIMGTPNKVNNAKAVVKALELLKSEKVSAKQEDESKKQEDKS